MFEPSEDPQWEDRLRYLIGLSADALDEVDAANNVSLDNNDRRDLRISTILGMSIELDKELLHPEHRVLATDDIGEESEPGRSAELWNQGVAPALADGGSEFMSYVMNDTLETQRRLLQTTLCSPYYKEKAAAMISVRTLRCATNSVESQRLKEERENGLTAVTFETLRSEEEVGELFLSSLYARNIARSIMVDGIRGKAQQEPGMVELAKVMHPPLAACLMRSDAEESWLLRCAREELREYAAYLLEGKFDTPFPLFDAAGLWTGATDTRVFSQTVRFFEGRRALQGLLDTIDGVVEDTALAAKHLDEGTDSSLSEMEVGTVGVMQGFVELLEHRFGKHRELDEEVDPDMAENRFGLLQHLDSSLDGLLRGKPTEMQIQRERMLKQQEKEKRLDDKEARRSEAVKGRMRQKKDPKKKQKEKAEKKRKAAQKKKNRRRK